MSRIKLLRQLLAAAETMIQGGLSETTRRCGQPRCACQHDPARRHGPHLYLTFRSEGKSRALYVPGEYAAAVRKAHAGWARFGELSSQLAALNREQLRRRMQRRKGSQRRRHG